MRWGIHDMGEWVALSIPAHMFGKTPVTSARNGTDTTKLRQEGKRDTRRPKQEASKHQNQNILIPFLVVDVVSQPKLVCSAAGQCMSCRINFHP